jgi:large subunit ribosomal protein LP1
VCLYGWLGLAPLLQAPTTYFACSPIKPSLKSHRPTPHQAEISSEQLKELIAATGNEVEPYWPMLFGKFLNGKIEELITSVGGGGGAAAPAGGAAAAAEAPKEEDSKKKKKEEKEEEADLGGGMDM